MTGSIGGQCNPVTLCSSGMPRGTRSAEDKESQSQVDYRCANYLAHHHLLQVTCGSFSYVAFVLSWTRTPP